MNIIMLGPPGAGKGTQAEVLSRKLGVTTLSTGNILRSAIAEGRPVGLNAKAFMDKGQLVPDDVIIGIVKDYLETHDLGKGCILDGVPRTLAQARMLDEMGVAIDAAISLEVGDEAIEERMGGRRTCTKCGATYHIKANPPKAEGVCDKCGEALTIRPDVVDPEDIEMLQDLILSAVNEVMREIEETSSTEMEKITGAGGASIPGLF